MPAQLGSVVVPALTAFFRMPTRSSSSPKRVLAISTDCIRLPRPAARQIANCANSQPFSTFGRSFLICTEPRSLAPSSILRTLETSLALNMADFSRLRSLFRSPSIASISCSRVSNSSRSAASVLRPSSMLRFITASI